MTVSGQISWPLTGSFVAVYGQSPVAADTAMTEQIEHAMEVMVVVVVRRGWLVGGLFAVIEVEGPCQRPVSDLARKWHGGANDDESWRSGPTFMGPVTPGHRKWRRA
jgi:hypothetical protein